MHLFTYIHQYCEHIPYIPSHHILYTHIGLIHIHTLHNTHVIYIIYAICYIWHEYRPHLSASYKIIPHTNHTLHTHIHIHIYTHICRLTLHTSTYKSLTHTCTCTYTIHIHTSSLSVRLCFWKQARRAHGSKWVMQALCMGCVSASSGTSLGSAQPYDVGGHVNHNDISMARGHTFRGQCATE